MPLSCFVRNSLSERQPCFMASAVNDSPSNLRTSLVVGGRAVKMTFPYSVTATVAPAGSEMNDTRMVVACTIPTKVTAETHSLSIR